MEQAAALQKAGAWLKKYRYALIVLLVGVLLMALGGTKGENAPAEDEGVAPVAEAGFDLSAFEAQLEESLSLIAGAGEVRLMLSLDSTEETVYAEDVRRSTSGGESVTYENSISVISSGGSGQSPVTRKCVYPKFRGAVVLCQGADRAEVCGAVTEAVRTACGIGSDQITVLKMESDT
jgi:stage III sporulation protein AG